VEEKISRKVLPRAGRRGFEFGTGVKKRLPLRNVGQEGKMGENDEEC